MSGLFSPEVERRLLEEAAAERAAADAADGEWTEAALDNLEQIASRYPWLDATTTDAIGSSGVPADDPAVAELAGAAAAESMVLGTTSERPLLSREMDRITEAMRAVPRMIVVGNEFNEAQIRQQATDLHNLREGYERFGVMPEGDFSDDEVEFITGERPERSMWRKAWDAVSETHQRGYGALYEEGGVFSTPYEQVVKPTVRTSMAAMDFLPQVVQGSASALNDSVVRHGWARGLLEFQYSPGFGAGHGFEQTELFAMGSNALSDVAEGELPRLDIGTGLFFDPNSEVGQERAQRQAQYEFVDGAPFTIGRWAAGGFTEAGTTEHRIMAGLTDLGLEIVGPGAVATDAILLAARNGRRTVNVAEATNFLNSDTGLEVLNDLTATRSFTEVDNALGNAADPSVVAAITQANDVRDVRRLLDSQLGFEVTDTPRLPRFQPTANDFQDHAPSIKRLTGSLPENNLSLTNSRQRVDNARRWLETSNATSDDIDRFSELFALAQTNDDVWYVAQTMLEETALRYLGEDVALAGTQAGTDIINNDTIARAIGRAWSRDIQAPRAYWGEVVTDPISGKTSLGHVDTFAPGGVSDMPSPQSYVETLHSNIPLPEARELREAFASPLWQAISKTRGQRATLDILDRAASGLTEGWKTTRLLRIGWPVKVLSEGQARLAFSGYSSIFTHPIDYVLHAASESGIVGGRARGLTGAAGTPVADMDAFKKAMFRSADPIRAGSAKRLVLADGFELYHKSGPTDRSFLVDAWADQAARLAEDPVVRMALNSDTFDEAAQFFWENMTDVRRVIQSEDPAAVLDIVRSRADADTWLQRNVFDRVAEMSGGNPDLIDAFRTRELDGKKMRPDSSPTAVSRSFRRAVDKRWDDLPEIIMGRSAISSAQASRWDGAVDAIFDHLMSRPSNKLERAPLWRQANWEAIEDLSLNLNPKDAGALIRNAKKANLSRAQIKRITQRARQTPPGNRTLTLEEIDALASARATNQVRKTLYDLSERNNFFDITRNIFPFGDAFFEVLTRWSSILAENPNRANKIHAATQEILNSAQDQEGFFTENRNGEETFVYPGAGHLASFLGVGPDVEFRAPLAGLSIATEFYPGFGPMVQIPAAAVLPDDPDLQWVRDVLGSGYGLPPDVFEDPEGLIADTVIPPWVRRALTGTQGTGLTADDDRIFANTATQIMMHKVANDPNWSLDQIDSEQAITDLVRESTNEARSLYLVRAGVQLIGPTSPQPEFYADLDGERMASWLIDEAYRTMVDQYGPSDAIGRFIDAYGADAAALVRPLSIDITSGGGMPVYQQGIDWVRENEFASEAYPYVYGFFAPPQSDPDDFVYDEYVARFRSGESAALEPEQAIRLFQNYIGGIRYASERERVLGLNGGSNTVEVQEYMRAYRAMLEQELPGYAGSGVPGVPDRVDVSQQITQLQEASTDARLLDAPLTVQLQRYFEERDYVMSIADGASFATGQSDANLRGYMYQVGSVIASESPEFAEVWDRVLYREFQDDHEKDVEGES